MFVAIDDLRETAVSADEIAARDHADNPSDQYRCLACGSPLEFTELDDPQADAFRHRNKGESCVAGGNASLCHRLAQEIAMKKLYNVLPNTPHLTEVDLEKRIGGRSDFVIADLLSESARVVIEIVYQNSHLSLKRRLRTLFDAGYAVMIVVVTNARISPDRLDHHLKKIGQIRVGRFDPTTWSLSLGSLIRPDTVDLDSAVWDILPDYCS